MLELRPLCGCSSIGRASAFQAECRGFEPLHPLLKPPLEAKLLRMFFFNRAYLCKAENGAVKLHKGLMFLHKQKNLAVELFL